MYSTPWRGRQGNAELCVLFLEYKGATTLIYNLNVFSLFGRIG